MKSLRLTMGEDSVVRIDGDFRGAVISCEEGTVNVTQQNDIEDHVLSEEDEFLIERKGRVIAWALSDASLEIVLPAADRCCKLERLRRLIAP